MDADTRKMFDKMYEVAIKAGENATLDFHQPRNIVHDSDESDGEEKK